MIDPPLQVLWRRIFEIFIKQRKKSYILAFKYEYFPISYCKALPLKEVSTKPSNNIKWHESIIKMLRMLKRLYMNFINHTFSQLTNAVRPFSTSKLKYMTTLSLHLNKKSALTTKYCIDIYQGNERVRH